MAYLEHVQLCVQIYSKSHFPDDDLGEGGILTSYWCKYSTEHIYSPAV